MLFNFIIFMNKCPCELCMNQVCSGDASSTCSRWELHCSCWNPFGRRWTWPTPYKGILIYTFTSSFILLTTTNHIFVQLESVLKDLPKKHGEHGENILPFGKLETSLMTGNLNTKYYRYKGSLTTPPCTEGVIWSVLTPTRTISKEQIELLKAPLSSDFRQNARPVQNLKDRKIERQPWLHFFFNTKQEKSCYVRFVSEFSFVC